MMLSLAACGETPTEAPSTQAPSTEIETSTEAPTETEKEADPYAVAVAPTAPSYIFDHTPTTDELRATVVQAMADALSV